MINLIVVTSRSFSNSVIEYKNESSSKLKSNSDPKNAAIIAGIPKLIKTSMFKFSPMINNLKILFEK